MKRHEYVLRTSFLFFDGHETIFYVLAGNGFRRLVNNPYIIDTNYINGITPRFVTCEQKSTKKLSGSNAKTSTCTSNGTLERLFIKKRTKNIIWRSLPPIGSEQ
jgi:hypothetical protein